MTTTTGVISFPIPAFSNVPIEPQFYQPSRFAISAITRGQTTTITTSIDMNYVIGQQVRLLIPSNFGSYQLNESQGYVLSIPASNQVVVSINSSQANPFILATTLNVAQILAIGDINQGVQIATGRTNPTVNGNTNTEVPGAFINISPA